MRKFQVFKDRSGAYRWRLIAPNGNIIADSAEGYSSKRACLAGIASVKRNARAAKIED
jgi:uncharacterized protein YegP (UPF0339 family)